MSKIYFFVMHIKLIIFAYINILKPRKNQKNLFFTNQKFNLVECGFFKFLIIKKILIGFNFC